MIGPVVLEIFPRARLSLSPHQLVVAGPSAAASVPLVIVQGRPEVGLWCNSIDIYSIFLIANLGQVLAQLQYRGTTS